MTPINMKKIAKKYAGLWVAIDREKSKPIASGVTLKEAVNEARKHGQSNPILTKVPSENLGYIL